MTDFDSSLQSPLPGENYHTDRPQEYVLSSWGRRVGATLIDGLILAVIIWGITIPLFFALFGGVGDIFNIYTDFKILPVLLYFLIAITVSLLYAPLLIARTNGQTIGKKLVGIRIIRTNFQPLTFGYAALREVGVKGVVLSIIGSVPFIGWIGIIVNYLWPLWDKENRAVHDMIVQTRVVDA